jgi:hypothetical protein
MYRVYAERVSENSADISQMPVKRWWMDDTYDKHAYQCFPLALTNRLGWAVSFPEDISFIWDGISDSSPDHIKVLSGNKYVGLQRANATVSFNIGIRFTTENNVTLLTMPPSNYFVDGATCFTTLISTSFFDGPLPIVYRVTQPNKVITIKANTPICTILPISLSELQNSEVVFEVNEKKKDSMSEINDSASVYEIRDSILSSGKWTNFYKNGLNWLGKKVGDHEVKSINLKVIE